MARYSFAKNFWRGHSRRVVFFVLFLFFLFGGAGFLWAASLKIPDFSSFDERLVSRSTKIYDRTGKILLYNASEDIRRTIVPATEISRHIKNATVAIEDDEFYDHSGFRPLAILRAFLQNLLAGGVVQGGSTITQQVVKNSLLTREKNLSRKLKELVLALKLEQVLPKDEILSVYLNEAPYGGTIYGVEEASLAFFGKQARDVGLAEAAYLAALPKAPTYYSPYGNHLEALEKRKNLVLKKMEEVGFVTKTEAEEARTEKIIFAKQEEHNIKAPHFVIYVLEYLEKKYGREAVEGGGLRIVTTLDWRLQQKAEDIVAKFSEENERLYNAKNAGLVAIDPKTGEILVMVGSRDYFDTEREGNFNVTLAKRQPGSAFKPFVYATAFNKGYTPDTAVFDVPTQFSTLCDAEGKPTFGDDPSVCYQPQNYDEKFRGPISFRNALAQSINVPAVKVLYLAGIRDSIETARALGISTLTDPDRYGLTLVLGGGEVMLLEMTSAYGVFAHDGIRNEPTAILRIEDFSGNKLEEHFPKPKRVLAENTARLISDVLSDNSARTPVFGSASPLYFPGVNLAAKTGTTNDYRDAWVIGYTPKLAVGAWAGNNDNTSIEKRVAGFVVAPMWHAFFEEALRGETDEMFPPPEPTPEDLRPVLRGVLNNHSILYWVDRQNPLGPAPADPTQDPQFLLWEKPVQVWVESQKFNPFGLTNIPQ